RKNSVSRRRGCMSYWALLDQPAHHFDRFTAEPIRRCEHDYPERLNHVDVTKFRNILGDGRSLQAPRKSVATRGWSGRAQRTWNARTIPSSRSTPRPGPHGTATVPST